MMDIAAIVGGMTFDQKVGQIITFEFVGNRLRPESYRKIEELHCGGLRITPHVYEAVNYQKRFDKTQPHEQRLAYHCAPDAYSEIIHRLQGIARARPLGIPLHVSIDQEGDFSCDYARGGVHLAPSAMGVAAAGDPALAFELYRAVGRQLRSIGATMVHSPVLDVNVNPDNPEICTRAFSDTPETVSTYALQCAKGLMSAGIVPTAKHFPGRGDSAVDLHYDLDVNKKSLENFEALDLPPYRTLIAAGLPAIMVSHQICPAFGGEEIPATVSPAVYRYIRERLNFNGVITTDAMGMTGVVRRFTSFAHACAEAAAAGADLVLAKCSEDLEPEVFSFVKRYVEEGRIPEKALNEKVARILKMKAEQGLWADYFNPSEAGKTLLDPSIRRPFEQAARRSLILVRDEDRLLPLSPDQKILVIEPYYREWQSKGFDNFYHPGMLSRSLERHSRKVTFYETSVDVLPGEEEMALSLADANDRVVVSSFFWRSCPTNALLVRKLIGRGKKVVVVANTPYENICLPEVKTLVVNWGQVPECQRAAADLLFGRAASAGRWPLQKHRLRGL